MRRTLALLLILAGCYSTAPDLETGGRFDATGITCPPDPVQPAVFAVVYLFTDGHRDTSVTRVNRPQVPHAYRDSVALYSDLPPHQRLGFLIWGRPPGVCLSLLDSIAHRTERGALRVTQILDRTP